MAAPGLSLAAESGDGSVVAGFGLLTGHRLRPASVRNCCTRDTCGIFLNQGLKPCPLHIQTLINCTTGKSFIFLSKFLLSFFFFLSHAMRLVVS